MKYILNSEGKDQTVTVPDNATFEISSITMNIGDGNGGTVPLLSIKDAAGKLLAAFVGVLKFYPEDMQPELDTWADHKKAA